MSSDPVRRVNLVDVECEPRPQLPDGFRRGSTRPRSRARRGPYRAERLRAPSRSSGRPYHYEEPEEEWLLVVSGTPTLRHPGGETRLEPWDVVFFPAGPPGAHLVRNDTESVARVAMFSSMSEIGAVVYPDTDLVWMWTDDDAVDLIVERGSAVEDIAPWAGGAR